MRVNNVDIQDPSLPPAGLDSTSGSESAATSARTVPRATYRIQFNAGFTLRQATELVPYLDQLGVSHLYASPLLKAMAGSTHGYDACDFGRLNPELGTDADFQELVAALQERGMGLVLDIVPNHMSVASPANQWWWDVLKNGQASRFAHFFDIDWESSDARMHGRVLLPVLGERYACALESGKLAVQISNGASTLRYCDCEFPLAPQTVPTSAATSLNPAEIDHLLEQQHYRLAFWRNGDSDLNYRRFFNITSLAGIRIEDETVFNEVHALIRRWLEQGNLDGVRVDHVDGLRDPAQYLHRLRQLAPHSWLVVEKILETGESLPADWPVAGTTGYDFLNRVGGLFIDPAGEAALSDVYLNFTGCTAPYHEVVLEKKQLVLRELLAAEINRLVALLLQICAEHWRYRDFTSAELQQALVELASAFSVYRTYVDAEAGMIQESDTLRIEEAAAHCRRAQIDPALVDFLAELLSLKRRGKLESDFVMRFQQLTGPAMAKGAEDTACYCFNRLLSLNEVGANPGLFGISVNEFHTASIQAQKRSADTMLASATHDTKHGEDFRARLNVLSEIPQAWRSAVEHWRTLNERHRSRNWPDRNMEYHLYQTLVGAWPVSLDRMLAYMEKAACEAKTYTSWSRRDPTYERALARFTTGVLGDAQFMAELEAFVARVAEAGWINSLGQALIKFTAPGVPDTYQGSELWDFNLVDPDNRRPVDFTLRRRLLEELPHLSMEQIWRRRAEGIPKLWVMRQALMLRRRQPDWFDSGSPYQALQPIGDKAGHLIAFRRGGAITVVPRLLVWLFHPMAESDDKVGQGALGVTRVDWGDTGLKLPAGTWHNELTGESVQCPVARAAHLLARFPVALLTQKEAD